MDKSFTTMLAVITALLMLTGSAEGQKLSKGYASLSAIKAPRSLHYHSEATYRLSSSKDVVMNLSGTTPVRDWAMTANGITGEAKLALSQSGSLLEVLTLGFVLPVRNLKGEVKAMEEDAYEALKADQHKNISFTMLSATVTQLNIAQYRIEALGSLTVAGVTKQVILNITASANRDGSIAFAGSQKLKMSDYDVERPSLLFGAIKAGNEMTLTYKLIFTK